MNRYRIEPQQVRNREVWVKKLRFRPVEVNGEVVGFAGMPTTYQLLLVYTGPDNRETDIKIKMRFNAAGKPVFTIQQPDYEVPATIKLKGRIYPDPLSPPEKRKGETERFTELQPFVKRLLQMFNGDTLLANLVLQQFTEALQ